MKSAGIHLWAEQHLTESHKLIHRFTDLVIAMNPEVVNSLNENIFVNYPYILDWQFVNLNVVAFPELREYRRTDLERQWDEPVEPIIVVTLHLYKIDKDDVLHFLKTIHTTMFDFTCKRIMQIKEKTVTPTPYKCIKINVPPEELILHWHPYARFLGKFLAGTHGN